MSDSAHPDELNIHGQYKLAAAAVQNVIYAPPNEDQNRGSNIMEALAL